VSWAAHRIEEADIRAREPPLDRRDQMPYFSIGLRRLRGDADAWMLRERQTPSSSSTTSKSSDRRSTAHLHVVALPDNHQRGPIADECRHRLMGHVHERTRRPRR